MRYKAVLFDLDGTINDSGPGVMNSVQYAIRKLGLPDLSPETLRRFIGPSLMYSFQNYGGLSEEDAAKAVVFYRECYSAGELFNFTVYDGIKELFDKIKAAGLKMAVATTKPDHMAFKVLEHEGFLDLFDHVAAPSPDDSSNDKSVLINRALEAMSLTKDDVVMIGDTRFDIKGAVKAGCDSIGITYGYGSREELLKNGAVYITDTPEGAWKIISGAEN